MASPDLKDGYIRYAHELDAALALADFTKSERIVLREILSVAFFKERPKLTPVVISPTGIANHAGGDKRHYVRAITDLVTGGVLRRVGVGTYLFLKDYETWTRDGKPRLTENEIKYCKDAKKANPSTESGDNLCPQTDQDIQPEGGQVMPPNGDNLCTQPSEPGDNLCPQPGTIYAPENVPPQTPLVGREEFKKQAAGEPDAASEPVQPSEPGEPPIISRMPVIRGADDLRAEIGSIKALTAERWNENVAAAVEVWASNDTGIDLAALRYAIRATAEDRDRRQMRISRPMGFIRSEYRKWFHREIPPGPVDPRANPQANGNGQPSPPVEYHVAPPEAKNRKWTMGGKR